MAAAAAAARPGARHTAKAVGLRKMDTDTFAALEHANRAVYPVDHVEETEPRPGMRTAVCGNFPR